LSHFATVIANARLIVLQHKTTSDLKVIDYYNAKAVAFKSLAFFFSRRTFASNMAVKVPKFSDLVNSYPGIECSRMGMKLDWNMGLKIIEAG